MVINFTITFIIIASIISSGSIKSDSLRSARIISLTFSHSPVFKEQVFYICINIFRYIVLLKCYQLMGHSFTSSRSMKPVCHISYSLNAPVTLNMENLVQWLYGYMQVITEKRKKLAYMQLFLLEVLLDGRHLDIEWIPQIRLLHLVWSQTFGRSIKMNHHINNGPQREAGYFNGWFWPPCQKSIQVMVLKTH